LQVCIPSVGIATAFPEAIRESNNAKQCDSTTATSITLLLTFPNLLTNLTNDVLTFKNFYNSNNKNSISEIFVAFMKHLWDVDDRNDKPSAFSHTMMMMGVVVMIMMMWWWWGWW
jgi:hypothetical protein